MASRILHGDCRTVLRTQPSGAVQTCVTSPPYYGLRDYGVAGQIGLEQTPAGYVAELVAVFAEVRRVLRDDGTLWLNLGDSYANVGRATRAPDAKSDGREMTTRPAGGAKPKDLLGIPWRVAFALQADGWYLRSDIIWHKPNPMPESIKDRPTSAHEHVFLLAKSERYFYDADAIREEWADGRKGASGAKSLPYSAGSGRQDTLAAEGKAGLGVSPATVGRNARNVWTIAPKPFKGSHFATMPIDLAERCILAGSRIGDTVLDPFGGSGTTGLAATRLSRKAILIELNSEYVEMASRRVSTGDSHYNRGVRADLGLSA